jgi:hypothetical protein
MTYLKGSTELLKNVQRSFLVSGGPKSGKTTLAATLSEQCPAYDKLADNKTHIELKDIAFVTPDDSGLDSLHAVNLSIAGNTVDYRGMLKNVGIPKFAQTLEEELKPLPAKGVKYFVFDPLSIHDVELVALALKKYPPSSVYGMVLNWHRDLFTAIKRVPFDWVIYTAHLHYRGDPLTSDRNQQEQQKMAKQATDIPGGGRLVPGITGQALTKLYEAQCGVISVLDTTIAPNKKEVRKLYVNHNSSKGFSGANRYRQFLDPIEIPDLKHCVGKIMRGLFTKGENK